MYSGKKDNGGPRPDAPGIDPLTGLSDRHFFHERLSFEFTRARRYGRDLAVIIADLDHFDRFNGIYGRASGDEALQAVASAIAEQVRETDCVARYGGEELAIVMPETTNIKALAMSERLLISVQNLCIRHEGFSPPGILTVSLGVAGLSPSDNNVEIVIERAGNALNRAKEAGRNKASGLL